jgi:hypothetical protein
MALIKRVAPHLAELLVRTLTILGMLVVGRVLMPYFGVDDDFPMHPKAVAAGNAAVGAWVRMGAHSVAHGMNGFISEKEARIFATPGQIKRLLQCVVTEGGVGLLEHAEQNGVKGYIFHDWTQPDVDTIRKIREVRAAAGRKGGRVSAAVRAARKEANSKEPIEANASADASASAQANGHQTLKQTASKTQAQEDKDKDIAVGTHLERKRSVSNARASNGHPVNPTGREPMSFNAILGVEEHPPDPPPPDRRIPTEAKEIIRAVLPRDLSHKIRWACSIQVATLLNQGIDQADVEAALREWFETDDDMYPGNIPYVHAKRLKRRDAPPPSTRKQQRIERTLARKSTATDAFPALPPATRRELG